MAGARSLRNLPILLLLLALALPLQSASSAPILERIDALEGDGNGTLVQLHASTATQLQVPLPHDALVVEATATLRTAQMPGLDSPVPYAPTLDIGADGTDEWRFDGGYGGFGRIEGTDPAKVGSTIDQALGKGERLDIPLHLPADAMVGDGNLSVAATATPYWGEERILTPPQQSPQEGEPHLVPCGDSFFAFWSSSNPALSPGTDADIIFTRHDGTDWTTLVSLSEDLDAGADHRPIAVFYQDRLWVFWTVRAVEDDYFHSIFLRYRTVSCEGEMGGVHDLTDPASDSVVNDFDVLLYHDQLFVVWNTNDPELTGGDDHDVVVSQSGGDDVWTTPELLTANDEWDLSVDAEVFLDQLVVAIDTNVRPGGWLIHLQLLTFDGLLWSPLAYPQPPPSDSRDNQLPSLRGYPNPRTGAEELWVAYDRIAWGSNGPEQIDVLARAWFGPSGGWGTLAQLTSPDDQRDHNEVEMEVFNGTLVAVWTTGDNTEELTINHPGDVVIYKTWGDVVVRTYDGTSWSTPEELTSLFTDDEAADSTLGISPMGLWAAWAEPTETDAGRRWDIHVRYLGLEPVVLDVSLLAGSQSVATVHVRPAAGGTGVPLPGWWWNEGLRVARERQAAGEVVLTTDESNVTMAALTLRMSARSPGRVHVRGLSVPWQCRFVTVQLTSGFNEALAAAVHANPGVQQVPVSVALGATRDGPLVIERLSLRYDLPPRWLGPIGPLQVREGEDGPSLVDLWQYVDDPEEPTSSLALRIEAANGSATHRLTIDSGRFLSLWPLHTDDALNWSGTIDVVIEAIDSFGLTNRSSVITIEVLPVNDAPLIMLSPITTDWETAVSVRLWPAVRDAEDSRPQLVLSLDGHNGSFDVAIRTSGSEGPVLVLTPHQRVATSGNVTVRVTDRGGLSAIAVVPVRVTPLPQPIPEDALIFGTFPWWAVVLVGSLAAALVWGHRAWRYRQGVQEDEELADVPMIDSDAIAWDQAMPQTVAAPLDARQAEGSSEDPLGDEPTIDERLR